MFDLAGAQTSRAHSLMHLSDGHEATSVPKMKRACILLIIRKMQAFEVDLLL